MKYEILSNRELIDFATLNKFLMKQVAMSHELGIASPEFERYMAVYDECMDELRKRTESLGDFQRLDPDHN